MHYLGNNWHDLSRSQLTRMAYRRYARRSRVLANRDRYSVESRGFSFVTPNATVNGLYQTSTVIVPADNNQGMRKVKHITLSLTTSQDIAELYWALVYVPQGTTVNPLFSLTGSPNGSLYEPNQFIMNCGIVDPTAGPIRFSSPLSRNLNSGDAVYLVVGSTSTLSASADAIVGVARYAITLQ